MQMVTGLTVVAPATAIPPAPIVVAATNATRAGFRMRDIRAELGLLRAMGIVLFVVEPRLNDHARRAADVNHVIDGRASTRLGRS
jgi:hypothetical protein